MQTDLTANARSTAGGKSEARKIRKAGHLPGVVYGPTSPAKSIAVDPVALVEMFRKSQNRNTIVNLHVDGASVPCLVREVQRNPLTREILHVDFYRVDAQHPVTVEVPFAIVGKAKGLAAGGRVEVLCRSLKVSCAFDKIPTSIEFDSSDLDVGDIARVSAFKAPEGVKILFTQDFPIATVAGKIQKEAAPAEAAPKKK